MDNGYNKRVFSGTLRKYLHQSRFFWLKNNLSFLQVSYSTVVELGCFDGKAIEYLPHPPSRYLGLDANWEGGLDMARQHWDGSPNMLFRECHTPEEMALNGERFDIAICLETLEHVPPQLVESYVEKLAESTQSYIFITIPNEKGIVCVMKYGLKTLTGRADYVYTRRELAHAFLGQMQKVERCEHKGFDYQAMIDLIARYFKIVSVSGLPCSWLPLCLNFGVGIIGKARANRVT